MKTKKIATIVFAAFLCATGFAQTPPAPPAPPAAPAPPVPPERHEREKLPKVPVTFLGLETSEVPRVVSEQLGLAKGFGLVVDYVVPDGPAAAAGVQQNDILKMLNDQILTEPDQLSKLIRSNAEGASVTLTVLRKGQEQKITVKLGKKEVPQRRSFGPGAHGPGDFMCGDHDFGDLGEQMNDLKEQLKDELGDANQGVIHDAVMKAHEGVARAREAAQQARERAREEAQRAREEGQRAREEGQRVREESRRANGQIRITRTDDTGLKTTSIDVNKAQIVFSDDKGELRLDNADGKKMLTAKDPQGRLLFSGPVETKEDRDKIPAEVRDRYEKLQERDLPSVASSEDSEDADDSEDMDEEGDDDAPTVEQVSTQPFPRNMWTISTLLI